MWPMLPRCEQCGRKIGRFDALYGGGTICDTCYLLNKKAKQREHVERIKRDAPPEVLRVGDEIGPYPLDWTSEYDIAYHLYDLGLLREQVQPAHDAEGGTS